LGIQLQPHGPHVVVITIDNQPRLNALTRAMLADLAGIWDELERGPCRCIVLTGAGDLMRWAVETAARIAANSPSAVQAVKQQISSTTAAHARSRETLEQELGDRVRASVHFQEGVAAFREKREPRYE
jgi:enoyl-CoA hydratase/carnithine racemase